MVNDLLDTALAAHGGLDRWHDVTAITVEASITGAFWYFKSKGDAARGRSLRGGHQAGTPDDGLHRSRQTVGVRALSC